MRAAASGEHDQRDEPEAAHDLLGWRTWPSPVSASPRQQHAGGLSSDEVELYHRTYTTLLRSSGETLVRVLEPSHRAMNSSLHPLAASEDLDLGAFLYATRRLPDEVADAKVIVMGQEASRLQAHGIGPIEEWDAARGARPPAPLVPRRRRARSRCCSPRPPTSTT